MSAPSVVIAPPADAIPTIAELEAAVESALALNQAKSEGRSTLEDQASGLRALFGRPAEPTRTSVVPVIDTSSELLPLTICVASGKGGVGKTNVAANLAAVLSALGHRVTLLDADFGTANADLVCGLSVVSRLDHVLTGELDVHDGGRRTLRDILHDAPGGFRLIPGSAGVARLADLPARERRVLFDELNHLDVDTDVLLIDTAAGIGAGVTTFVQASDMCLVVSSPEPTSIADAYALIKCASSSGTELRGKFRLVINQCADAAEARRVAARLSAVCDRFLGLEVPMLGWVAQDMRVAEAVRARQLFTLRSPNCEASRNVSAIAASLALQIGLPARTSLGLKPPRRLAGALRRLLGA